MKSPFQPTDINPFVYLLQGGKAADAVIVTRDNLDIPSCGVYPAVYTEVHGENGKNLS
jgi:hypothetical protein